MAVTALNNEQRSPQPAARTEPTEKWRLGGPASLPPFLSVQEGNFQRDPASLQMATQARASLPAGWEAADGPKGTEYPELLASFEINSPQGARGPLSFISEGASTGRSEAVPASALPLETRDAKGGSPALSFSPRSVLKFWSEERKQSSAQLRVKTRREE